MSLREPTEAAQPPRRLVRQTVVANFSVLDELRHRLDLFEVGTVWRSCFGLYALAPNICTFRSGQWIWYRSKYSVCKRFKLSFAASIMFSRSSAVLPPRSQSRRPGPAILLATISLSRV